MARAPKPSAPEQSKPIYEEFPPGELPPAPQKVMKVCATCAGWIPRAGDPIIGDCMPSRKALPAPLVTLDLHKCSRWTLAE